MINFLATTIPEWVPSTGGVLGFLCSALFWFARRDLDRIEQTQQRLQGRCDKVADEVDSVEKEILRLHADLAREFVHKDDYIARMALLDGQLEKIMLALCEIRELQYKGDSGAR